MTYSLNVILKLRVDFYFIYINHAKFKLLKQNFYHNGLLSMILFIAEEVFNVP